MDKYVFKEIKRGKRRVVVHKTRMGYSHLKGINFAVKNRMWEKNDFAGRSTTTDRVDMEFIHHFFPEEGNSAGSIQSPTVMPIRWTTLKIKWMDKKKWHLNQLHKEILLTSKWENSGFFHWTEIKVELIIFGKLSQKFRKTRWFDWKLQTAMSKFCSSLRDGMDLKCHFYLWAWNTDE